MKPKVIFLIIILMVASLVNTVYAANWTWVQRNSDQSDVYFDADSAFKDAGTLNFWVMFVYAQPQESGLKKIMWQYEVTVQRPRTFRTLVSYAYDSGNSELYKGKGRNYGTSLEGSATDQAATAALAVAKPGTTTGQRPGP